jgi:hypothetical protein
VAVNTVVLESHLIISLDNRINALASGTNIDIGYQSVIIAVTKQHHASMVPNKHADTSLTAMVGYLWMVMFAWHQLISI